ncbi:prephenate dehydratase [Tenacibaculum dicentrarchi]|uniref:prephenate dehydratase n=1 Tax=Tenacibaculum dicentrarchi TaxID=669041 RepID=A0ABP1EHJ5_9FLAO|nr:prephenate dehydratase [Tenacibaculum dicentrarchi]MCD8407850.1 prephenate dehydratase [Tenacibaculum dicentrarchi]MCD8415089.1 prephenate dehydratase [Tenacibaculum dicentrarchi]MCD8420412.1 prephenate dehydratase [Tenacibaculum dicentrarchi]MCD8425448.1 prephenate dehydratase [Tenacibaculum dicentrarchi]
MKQIIAIQGAEGSNHHKVARDFYGTTIGLKECMSFDVLVDSLLDKTADVGIMALENTIAGSIIPNYALIDKNNLQIIGEEYLNIHHHLMALPNQKIEDITEVCSHPMALLQCKEFLKKHKHIKLVEDVDTAEVAKRIAKNNLKGVAAIAPKIAAEIFGLNVIEDDIQTMKENSTRFVIVQTKESSNGIDTINKASLKFVLDHKRGSLATLLNVLSDCKMNLTKIQSLPVIEAPWKYSFFVDVTFNEYKNYEKAISIIKIMAEEFKVLGAYKNGRK